MASLTARDICHEEESRAVKDTLTAFSYVGKKMQRKSEALNQIGSIKSADAKSSALSETVSQAIVSQQKSNVNFKV